MEKLGYFRILPRELIDELHKYFFAYFRDKSLIMLDAATAIGHMITEDEPIYLEFYYIKMYIRFPNTEYTELEIPFDFQFPTLKLFLESIISKHTFLFIDKKDLKINKVEPEHNFKIDERDKIEAIDATLYNGYAEYVPIHMDYNRLLRFLLLNSDGGLLAELYRCTLLQTEVMTYKLVQLYNDVVTKHLKPEY